MERYVPLVSYTKAPTEDNWAMKEERECETRQRHWGLLKWVDSSGNRATTEMGVITESMPDFCGGLLVYSPFVNTFDERNSWTTHFCAPGAIPPTESVPTEWKEFDDSMAVDICAFLDKECFTRQEAEDFAFECIAAQIAGEMLYHGKRGFMAADWMSGRMTRLTKTMASMGTFVATPSERFKVSSIEDRHMGYLGFDGKVLGSYAVSFWIEPGREWYNSNSGNTVHWLQGGLEQDGEPQRSEYVRCSDCDEEYSRERESECPSCGYDDYYYDDYYDDDEPSFTCKDWVNHKSCHVINAAYARRARRFFWRNG